MTLMLTIGRVWREDGDDFGGKNGKAGFGKESVAKIITY
jgi:hypothetical protein